MFCKSTKAKSNLLFGRFLHCLLIESFVFKKIKKLHMYSSEDELKMKKLFSYKNLISIPNFNESRKINKSLNKINFSNENKILLMGDFNQLELFEGLKKFKS